MYPLIKDHKITSPIKPGQKIPSRAVNGPGPNVHLSELIGDVVEPIADEVLGRHESSSTEDVLAAMDMYNENAAWESVMEDVNRFTEENVKSYDVARWVVNQVVSNAQKISLERLEFDKQIVENEANINLQKHSNSVARCLTAKANNEGRTQLTLRE